MGPKRTRKPKQPKEEEEIQPHIKDTINIEVPTDKIIPKVPYIKSIINHTCVLKVSEIYNKNFNEIIEKMLIEGFEGKCKEQGYIKPKSVKLLSSSYGDLMSSEVSVDAIFECMVFNAVEGDLIECVATSITHNSGVKAEVYGERPSPAYILIPRDFHSEIEEFHKIEVGNRVLIRTLNQTFTLNESHMIIIGQLC